MISAGGWTPTIPNKQDCPAGENRILPAGLFFAMPGDMPNLVDYIPSVCPFGQTAPLCRGAVCYAIFAYGKGRL